MANKKRKKKVRNGFKVFVVLLCAVLLTGIVIATAMLFKKPPQLPEQENEQAQGEETVQTPDDGVHNQPEAETPSDSDVPAVTLPENEDINTDSTPEVPEEPEKEPVPETPKPAYNPGDDPAAHIPEAKDAEWNLILVNPWNKLPADYEVKLTQLKNGHSVDERAYPSLQEMMDAARDEGLSPLICSSYRTQQKQTTLFTNQVNRYLAQGWEYDDAVAEAGKAVAVPGTSEHQLGLAVDIVATSYQLLNEEQENTAEQKWLMENSYKYGWILRYPSDKSELTGIIYEPWHYRYVGKEAAKEIYEKGICFEEYIAQLSE